MSDQQFGGSQGSYRETPYENASWEVIGEIEDHPEFVPLELEIVKTEEFRIDPMFANYGGVAEGEETSRFHSPENGEAFPGQEGSGGQVAEQQLEALRAEYEAKLEQIRQEAFQSGIEQGTRQLQEQLDATVQQSKSFVEETLQDLFLQVEERVKRIESEAVHLSLEVARKIIDQAVEINPEYILEVVREAMSHVGTAHIKKVRVSPQDMEFVEVIGVRKMMSEFEGNWDFEADQTVHSGCVVDTSAGEIDLQFDKAWQRIKDQIVRFVR
ncbi:MAG: hypothetical protein KDD64_08590 [Bdellovibrionales bacterium]|nr:hypothetical protein [Bdellovibrionales bacterium]